MMLYGGTGAAMGHDLTRTAPQDKGETLIIRDQKGPVLPTGT